MAVKVSVTAEVLYTCTLTKKDEETLNNFLENNPEYDPDQAIHELYWSGEINLYQNCVESDFNTISVDYVEGVD